MVRIWLTQYKKVSKFLLSIIQYIKLFKFCKKKNKIHTSMNNINNNNNNRQHQSNNNQQEDIDVEVEDDDMLLNTSSHLLSANDILITFYLLLITIIPIISIIISAYFHSNTITNNNYYHLSYNSVLINEIEITCYSYLQICVTILLVLLPHWIAKYEVYLAKKVRKFKYVLMYVYMCLNV